MLSLFRMAPQRFRRGPRARRLAAFKWAALLVLVLATLPAVSCSGPEPPTGERGNILDDAHRILRPGVIDAQATGVGCGGSSKEALTSARRVAKYNLRSLTGPARYLVRFRKEGEFTRGEQTCVEVVASAYAP